MGEKYEKLVRDKVVEILKEKGIPYEERTATPEEKSEVAFRKLTEEVAEFLEAKNLEELADVDQALDLKKSLPEFKGWEEMKAKKLAEKGGFEKMTILKGEK
ncbi:hypothetical protein A2914_01080 [Candidatus Nomurabacteria bacterium RIFCSPLOWO2_01_FULL_41_21]|uniref:Phosphoribosyl-ATP pyrophosphohydrolase n=2 Tax=Candidatus Nomuraibacteriota TaxID=1752729 RepID=A0A1F6V287_9BACT|nr:MAG: hypothetical protein A2733_02170 [Candidatus Nomurabacteria bacterium RIFCSPHIGHO2_01_FULL_40_20]OGI87906.1 MAG: hypothetical protein A2914_01080 [Candidatus Nomurabacteria bacterium RIFCSPLOWO2_01_FULL_41_21]